MNQQGPICLDGPVSRSRAWWRKYEADHPREPRHDRPQEGSEEMRLDLIAKIKSEIASGVYDTPAKLEIALDRMIGGID